MTKPLKGTLLMLPMLAALTAPDFALAQTCSKTSPAHTTALLELYSSEGCDSCPPADKFVSQLYKTSGLSMDQVVPLALHVDYWDYIGWKDRFAKPVFTERQRWLVGLAHSRNVYTPEIFLAGKEWRDWRGGVMTAVQQINAKPAQADIRITLEKSADNKLQVGLLASTKEPGKLYFALVESGLVSKVNAGENRGVTLQHDYVAQIWGEPLDFRHAGNQSITRQISLSANAAKQNLAVTAFVQSDQGVVLQALSLPLCAGM